MAAQMGGLSQNEKAQALVKQLGRASSASFAAKSPTSSASTCSPTAHGERLRVAGRPDLHYRGAAAAPTPRPSSPACSAMRSATSSPAIPPSASPSSSSRRDCWGAGRRQRRLHHRADRPGGGQHDQHELRARGRARIRFARRAHHGRSGLRPARDDARHGSARDVVGGSRQPEFMSTLPAPENRSARIKEAIAKQFPDGVPQGLKP